MAESLKEFQDELSEESPEDFSVAQNESLEDYPVTTRKNTWKKFLRNLWIVDHLEKFLMESL